MFLRVAGDNAETWEGRRHFFFAAAHAMRDILVEQARRKAGVCAVLEPPFGDVLAVHEALQEPEERDPLKARVVLLRNFTGLTTGETAAVLGLAGRTLDRHWRYIRAWLMKWHASRRKNGPCRSGPRGRGIVVPAGSRPGPGEARLIPGRAVRR